MVKLSASYTTISANDLLHKVVSEYQIENLQECLFWSRGSNDIYEVRCEDGIKYSLRIYRHAVYPRDSIEFEMQALLHLHGQGFPVAYPIPKKSGGYLTEIDAAEGPRFAILTTFAKGEEPEYGKADSCRQFGQSLAQMHLASAGFEPSVKRPDLDLANLLDERVNDIRPYVKHRPKDLLFLEQLARELRDAVMAAPASALDTGLCHGDVHGGNNHLHEGEIMHFDFEECGFGFRAFDLATFKWGALPDKDKDSELWPAFIEGYQSVREIGETDLAIHDTFVVIRHIWLIAFHMRNAHDFSYELTSDGYITHHWKRLKKLSGKESEAS